MAASACSGTSSAEWQDASSNVVETVNDGGRYEFAVAGDVGLVVRSSDNGALAVHAIDISTKERLWELDEKYEANVWVASDKLVVENEEKAEIRSLSSGEELFVVPLQSDSDDAGRISAVTESAVVVQDPSGQQGELATFDLDSGAESWAWQGENDEGAGSADSAPEVWANAVSATPSTGYPHELNSRTPTIRTALDTDIIYVSDDYDMTGGEAAAVDVESGKQLWKQQSPSSGWLSIMEQVDSDTVVMRPGWLPHDSTDCVRDLISVDTSKEEATHIPVPRFYRNPDTKDWECATGDEVTPVSSDGILGQDQKYRPQLLDLATGDALWTAEHAAEPLALHDGMAIYRTWDDNGDSTMHVVDTADGETLWTKPVSTDLDRVIASNGQVLQTTKDGTWTNDLMTGEQLWRHDKSRPLHLSKDAYYFLSADEELRITTLRPDGN